MKTKLALTLILSFALVLALAMAMAAYAQEPGAGKKQVDIGVQDIGSLGLNDPPPTDYSTLYMFTGLINDTSAREATAIHCTNFGTNTVDVRVEAWNTNPTTTYSNTVTINPGWTKTFGTQIIASFPQDVILSPQPSNIYQGSGRVLTKQHSNVICTVHVLDPANDPPVFVDKLALFDSNGNPIGQVRKVYLPVIIKS